ncbi:MAG: methylamine utilization protein MauE [Proteobacteria bacterium]|nr:methylamine utilization protein MauE [Pseudomonadota bacterium]
MLDPAIGLLATLLFVLLFAGAALHKIRAPAHFAQAVAAYQLLPERLAGAALVIPALEALVALGLLFPATRGIACGLGILLLLSYAWAIGVNLRRGRTTLDCGCGGPDERRPIAAWMAVRNLVLAAGLALLAQPWQARPLAAADILTVGGGCAVGALLYASLERLLSRVVPQGTRLVGR